MFEIDMKMLHFEKNMENRLPRMECFPSLTNLNIHLNRDIVCTSEPLVKQGSYRISLRKLDNQILPNVPIVPRPDYSKSLNPNVTKHTNSIDALSKSFKAKHETISLEDSSWFNISRAEMQ